MDDEKIIGLFWERNESAIQEVSNKYNNLCFHIARKILANTEDSEECVNDTWFTAWRRMPPFKPNVLSAFLSKITRGLAIDQLRKRNAQKRMDAHMVDISGELEMLEESLSYTLDELMEQKELLQTINNFLRNLCDMDQDIFVRRYWYMDSINDIAKRHGIPTGSVKSKLSRSRNKLLKLVSTGALGERRIIQDE